MAGIIDLAEPRAEVRISQTERCRLDRGRESLPETVRSLFFLCPLVRILFVQGLGVKSLVCLLFTELLFYNCFCVLGKLFITAFPSFGYCFTVCCPNKDVDIWSQGTQTSSAPLGVSTTYIFCICLYAILHLHLAAHKTIMGLPMSAGHKVISYQFSSSSAGDQLMDLLLNRAGWLPLKEP